MALAALVVTGIVFTIVPRGAARPEAAFEATEQPTATITAIPTETATPTATPLPTATPTPVVHVVLEGDTLLSIAVSYDVTVESIEQANDLSEESLLQIGQELVIPWPTPEGSAAAAPSPTPTPHSYVVSEGDTLLGIATEQDIGLESLLEANGLTENSLLSVGQNLVIPAPTPTPTPDPADATPTPIVLPTRDPSLKYDVPPLLWPPDGARLSPSQGPLVLSWVSVGILEGEEFYVVELRWRVEGEEHPVRQWTRATSWRVPETLQPSGLAHYGWGVDVRRQTAVDSRGDPIGPRISQPSERRSFTWTR